MNAMEAIRDARRLHEQLAADHTSREEKLLWPAEFPASFLPPKPARVFLIRRKFYFCAFERILTFARAATAANAFVILPNFGNTIRTSRARPRSAKLDFPAQIFKLVISL